MLEILLHVPWKLFLTNLFVVKKIQIIVGASPFFVVVVEHLPFVED